MKDLRKRIEALGKEIEARKPQFMTVYYKDGTQKKIHPGDAVRLALEEGETIDYFEDDPNGANQGCLMGLANALLIDPEEDEAGDDGKEGNE